MVTVEEEFQKNPDLKAEDLQCLNEWLDKQPNLPAIPDWHLIVIHHSCYYSLQHTKACIESFFKIQASTPEFFLNRNVQRPELQKMLTIVDFGVLPVRDPNGCLVVYHRLRQFEPSLYVFADTIKLLFMTIEATLMEHGTLPGHVMLMDMRGVRLGHLLRLNLTLLRRFFNFVQDGNPVRLKAVHVVNTSSLLDRLMALIRPFLKKELMAILHFHSGDNETLLKFLPHSCLPSNYGGELDSVEVLHARNTERLEELADVFLENEKLYSTEDKRPGKGKSKCRQSEPNLRSLDID